ncbi:surface protease GP63 [Trypanosoma theileri]|uniref:Leishmanolysin-like peptidase n=1 Tax=Trypanosoma theileri TaxID=67003 RepID=A0A1X0NDK7_9TRYP|nr:surface protease GP63 [Trypanosoma theileri]ORC81072.1 surface protease GP63 [Trypanosoma theileri]
MEKHSMRYLLWAALFLLYCSCGCLAAVVQQLPQKGESALQAYTVSTAAKAGEDWQPIRIAVYTKYVEDVMNYCNKKEMPSEYDKTTDLKKNLESQFEKLCTGENKMTTKRMHILFRDLLPQAIKLHTDRLKVKPLQGNLKLWKEDYEGDISHPLIRICDQFLVPEEHLDSGVSDADFMLYVRLSPYGQDYHICTRDKNNQVRPTSARISFVPKEINATRYQIRLAARNIAFGLGFGEFVDIEPIAGTLPITVNGVPKRSTKVVLSGNVKKKMVEHYNCQDYAGMILRYNGSTSHSEWERRIAKDELMSPYTGEPTGMFYTALTLAVFDAMDFYQADFDMAEPMSWGKGFGCELFTSTCKDIIEKDLGNLSKTFCKESDGEHSLQCTSDRFGLGVCSEDDNTHGMPDGYKFFEAVGEQSEMMKECPIIKPFQQTMCETGDETLMPGSIVSNMSRCLDVEEPVEIDENGKKVKVQGICAKVKCDKDKQTVSVQLKGYDENKWHKCSDDEVTIDDVEGSVFKSGTIVCPKFEEVCTKETGTDPFNISYNVVNVPEDEEPKQEEKKKEAEVQSNSSTNSEASGDLANADTQTSANTQGGSAPAAPDVNGSSQQASAAPQGNSTNTESAREERRGPQRRRRDTDATTSQSAANPNGNEDAIQSPNTVLNGTTIAERQIKEETLKQTNVTVMFGTDGSTVSSYMVPLALLVCVVGFVIVP